MNWPLPPKRFQPTDHQKYDPIRGRRWFGQLSIRRAQIRHLEAAYKRFVGGGVSRQRACDEMGVDSRELRDYARFVEGKERPGKELKHFHAITTAYERYCLDEAKRNFRHYLEQEAPLWGLIPRQLVELWEVDPKFYPKGYEKEIGREHEREGNRPPSDTRGSHGVLDGARGPEDKMG